MKKIFGVILAFAVSVMPLFGLTGCANRDEQLKIYNWGQYMDPRVLDDFEKWYKQETGKTVEAIEKSFETNEEMYTQIQMAHSDFDLVCPSDYMIEQMIREKLVKPVDKEIIDIEQVIKPEYIDVTKEYDRDLTYSVPFMYGTFGIMYDYTKTNKHIYTWDPIFGSEFKGKIYMKNSVREAYAAAGIYNNRDELSALSGGFSKYGAEYRQKLQSIYEDTSSETIENARRTLVSMKSNLLKWDNDDAKFKMAQNTKQSGALGLFWSCDAGYVMGDYVDDDDVEFPGNKNLWYRIPEEGGNVYVDSFVIPKYARNIDAANYFLKYICMKGPALLNSEYIGAISPVTEAYDAIFEDYTNQNLTDEDSFFKGVTQEWKDMYMDMMFPSAETLKRCGIMKDFKEANSAVMQMFANIVG